MDETKITGSEPSSLGGDEETLNKVANQLEFYFGDANLKRDRYLRQMIEGSTTGFVPISEVLTFSRLKALTSQPSIIAQAAKLSFTLQVSEDNLGIARKAPLPKNEQPVDACIWIKGLPFNATLDEISQAVKTIENVETYSIFLRKDKQQLFNGEAFVELGNAEEVNLIVEKGVKSLLFRNQPLDAPELLPLADWMSKFKKTTKPPKPTNHEAAAKAPIQKDANTDKDKPTEIEAGALLVLEGLMSDCSREAIKAVINARITFIDYERGNEKAIVRFPSADDCKQGVSSLEKEKDKNIVKLTSYRVMDAAETSDYAKLVDEKRKLRMSSEYRPKSGGGSNGRDRRNKFHNKIGNEANQPKPKRSRDDPRA